MTIVFVTLFSSILRYMHKQTTYRIYMASIVVPIMIYWYMYDSEGENDRVYVAKRCRNSLIRRVTSSVGKFIQVTFNNIITHAENMSVKRRRETHDRPYLKNKSFKNKTRLVATALTAMALQAQKTHWETNTSFDTDSYEIGIDNRCSACISGQVTDFVGTLKDTNRTIKGFMGTKTTNVQVGTLHWKWLDDDGRAHKFLIPNSYYVPNCNMRLLSPQHWAKTVKDTKPEEGTGCTTNSKCITLWWKQKKFLKTVPLSKTTNVATFRSAPGFIKYANFCHEAAITFNDEDNEPLISDETITMEDDEVQMVTNTPEYDNNANKIRLQFDSLNGRTKIVSPIIDEPIMTSKEAQLLQFHRDFGHIPFSKLQIMAKNGIIPPALAKCPIPACSACMVGMLSKKRTRDKPKNDYEKRKISTPGQLTSVDMMVSPTPGLIAQMASLLTRKRYKYATVYVDQASRLGYLYLQQDSSVETTLKGKEAYERYARSHGVHVKGYHADNGIFRAKGWVNHCNANNQTLTFAAVNAHHQNGIAERRIRQLQDQARSMMIFAKSRWPKCIDVALWPYAMLMACDSINLTPSMQDPQRRSPMQIFSKSNTSINYKHHRPFGCPAYVLDPILQQNKPLDKWKPRSRPGIYLGPSPMHNRNVGLILNVDTGRVSPQFHIKFDRRFHTVIQSPIESRWQQEAGLRSDDEDPNDTAKPSKEATDLINHLKRKRGRPPKNVHHNQEGDTNRPKRKTALMVTESPNPNTNKAPITDQPTNPRKEAATMANDKTSVQHVEAEISRAAKRICTKQPMPTERLGGGPLVRSHEPV